MSRIILRKYVDELPVLIIFLIKVNERLLQLLSSLITLHQDYGSSENVLQHAFKYKNDAMNFTTLLDFILQNTFES